MPESEDGDCKSPDGASDEFQYIPGVNSNQGSFHQAPRDMNLRGRDEEDDTLRRSYLDENWIFTIKRGGKTFGKHLGKQFSTLAKRVKGSVKIFRIFFLQIRFPLLQYNRTHQFFRKNLIANQGLTMKILTFYQWNRFIVTIQLDIGLRDLP